MFQPYITDDFEIDHIIDNVYIGNISTAVNIEELQNNGITHILSVMNGSFSMFPEKFVYKHVHINDDAWISIDKHFEEIKKNLLKKCEELIDSEITTFKNEFLYNMLNSDDSDDDEEDCYSTSSDSSSSSDSDDNNS